MCAHPVAVRRLFARDLLNLTLADPATNRHEKRHYDAVEWLPDVNQCWFAARVVEVRRKWDLTVDEAEALTLDAVLTRCPSTARWKAPLEQ